MAVTYSRSFIFLLFYEWPWRIIFLSMSCYWSSCEILEMRHLFAKYKCSNPNKFEGCLKWALILCSHHIISIEIRSGLIAGRVLALTLCLGLSSCSKLKRQIAKRSPSVSLRYSCKVSQHFFLFHVSKNLQRTSSTLMF